MGRVIRAAFAAFIFSSWHVAQAGDLEPLAVELVTGDVMNPTFVTAPVGDSRLFVLEQNSGKIALIVDGERLEQPFLDIGELITPGGERGLLGLAFPPDYATSGAFYVAYNNLAGDLEVTRYHAFVSAPNRADPESAEILLSIPKLASQHNGGALDFDASGHLLVSTGDGTAGYDPVNHAQRLDVLLGKILRLDVSAGSGPYEIPVDNPFVSDPLALPEIFAYGLRNPWRMSVDLPTGDIWLGDVGQGHREEIDRIAAGTSGQNFGWRCLEGTECTGLAGCECTASNLTGPTYEYTHDTGCAVVGGEVYRGTALTALEGRYLFGDYCTSRVWSITVDSEGAVDSFIDHTSELLPLGIPSLGLISSFGHDGFGELYICSYSFGAIYRVIPKPPATDCDLDGIADDIEIKTGTAFDVNFNAVPDNCELTLSIGPLIPGLTVLFEFLGADAGQPVLFATSTRAIGDGPCFFNGKVCLSLLQPIMLSQPVFADSQGQISSPFTVPELFQQETEVFVQAVVLNGNKSKVSAPLTKIYMP